MHLHVNQQTSLISFCMSIYGFRNASMVSFKLAHAFLASNEAARSLSNARFHPRVPLLVYLWFQTFDKFMMDSFWSPAFLQFIDEVLLTSDNLSIDDDVPAYLCRLICAASFLPFLLYIRIQMFCHCILLIGGNPDIRHASQFPHQIGSDAQWLFPIPPSHLSHILSSLSWNGPGVNLFFVCFFL